MDNAIFIMNIVIVKGQVVKQNAVIIISIFHAKLNSLRKKPVNQGAICAGLFLQYVHLLYVESEHGRKEEFAWRNIISEVQQS